MIAFFDGNFNYTKFLDNERIIMMQWEDEENIFNMTESELINRFSLYMCHINDEMKEMYDAKTNNEGIDNYIKEIIDVAMYTASAINLFNVKYKSLTGEYLLDNLDNLSLEEIYAKDYFQHPIIYNIEEIITFTSIRLSAIRELFPQRKWHKLNQKFDVETYKEVLKKSYLYGINIILDIMTWAEWESNNDNDKISKFINEKQRKIIRDALKTGKNHYKKYINELEHLNQQLQEEE